MRKEPGYFFIFRLIISASLVFFALMIYWSMENLEKNVIEIKEELQGVKERLEARPSYETAREDIKASLARPHIDPALPNLLEEDPFYLKVLPKLLGDGFKPWGVKKASVTGKPENLHPFSNWYNVSSWRNLCIPSVANQKFGIFETLTPDLAIKMEVKGDPPEYWIHLRDNLYWQPLKREWFSSPISSEFLTKHQVTAHDFKFFYDVLMNQNISESGAVALRTYYGDIEEIKVIDDLTFTVKWKIPKYISKQLTGGLKPLARHIYAYFADGSPIIDNAEDPSAYRKNPLFAFNFSNHWAKNVIPSIGPWLFDGLSDRMISFKRDPHYFEPLDALALGYDFEFTNSPDTAWQQFKEGKLDTYIIRPEQLIELDSFLASPAYNKQAEKGEEIKRLDYIGRSYQYIGWNAARTLFQTKKVRQALTMAIDRERIIRQTLNGMGIPIHGPFYPYSSANNPDIKPWPFDPQKAKQMLAEEGWFDSGGDGVIDKNGQSFSFSLSYYVKNPTSKAIAEYVQKALQQLGIKVNLNGIDIADLTKIFEDKDFDALILGWALGTPPEDPRQLWYSTESRLKGSSNAVGFANQEADEIIDKLDFEKDLAERIKLYHRFDEILHEEQPYTFLFTPKQALLYRSRLENVFIPTERPDLVPGANIAEPDLSVSWLRHIGNP